MVAINAITRESMDMIVDEIMNVMNSDYLSEESKGAEIERVLVNNGLAMVIEENDNEWISKNDELPNAYEEVKSSFRWWKYYQRYDCKREIWKFGTERSCR